MIIPSTNRIIGEEPAVERYSFVIREIKNAPATIPTISGRTYCTTAAWCNFMAPAVSRIKQAMQIAIFFGFPKKARAAAVIPSITPDSASVFFRFRQIHVVPLFINGKIYEFSVAKKGTPV